MGVEEITVPYQTFITKEFLEKILRKKIISFKASGGSNPGDNFITILIALEIVVEDKEDPLHLLYKTFPVHPTRQKFLTDNNIFVKECWVYDVWLPELNKFQKSILGDNGKLLKLAMPEMVAGAAIDYKNGNVNDWKGLNPMLNNFVLMVDVRKTYGFYMADTQKGLGYYHIKVVLEELAKYYALGHAYRIHNKLANIRSRFPLMFDHFFCNPSQKPNMEGMFKGHFQRVLETCKDFLKHRPEIAESLNKFKDHTKASEYIHIFLNPDGMDEEKVESFMRVKPEQFFGAPLKEQWIVAGHGDCWSNNMLFKTGDNGIVTAAVLVDLQLFREACITMDLAYLLYTSTDTDFRKKYLEEVLGWFHERFVHFCGVLNVPPFSGFTLENFRRKFHRSKIAGLLFAVIINPMSLQRTESSVNLDSVDIKAEGEGEDDWGKMFEKFDGSEEDFQVLRERFTNLLAELYDEGVL